ncbi:MAG: hypothetical protein ACRD96_05085, partial [Bryobacteraceae bacterium]
MVYFRLLAAILALAIVAYPLQKKKREKKEKEEITQVLEALPDPPAAVVAETKRLVFHVTPLSSKGLLSQQVRDGLRSLLRQVEGARVAKIRAFVAGSGDLRRVGSIVSEEFSERRLALPALTVVQVGGLPMEGGQVVLESMAVAKKDVNPHGVAFISGQQVTSEQPMAQVAPLAAKSLADVKTALRGTGLDSAGVMRVTCLMSSLEDVTAVRGLVSREFPGAAANFVQLQRAAIQGVVECEAVARLRQPVAEPLRLVNPAGLASSPNYSQVALVTAPRVALTGIQIAFGYQ